MRVMRLKHPYRLHSSVIHDGSDQVDGGEIGGNDVGGSVIYGGDEARVPVEMVLLFSWWHCAQRTGFISGNDAFQCLLPCSLV